MLESYFVLPVRHANTDRRGLKEALSYLRASDTLVVWKLDRLGRTVKGLVDVVINLENRQIHFKSVTDSIDTKAPACRFFFHVMASLAQLERELIVEPARIARRFGAQTAISGALISRLTKAIQPFEPLRCGLTRVIWSLMDSLNQKEVAALGHLGAHRPAS
jgi:hypothetical protein